MIWDKFYDAFPIIFERARNLVWFPSAINPNIRVLKYIPEMHSVNEFHTDGPEIQTTTRSFMSLVVYLNDDFTGGDTSFANPVQISSTTTFAKRDVVGSSRSFKPKTGVGIIFPHSLQHCGVSVSSGVKYALRTDVMYSTMSQISLFNQTEPPSTEYLEIYYDKDN